ncbi:hypothetical protein AAFC00_001337 [Neodothiora populina]|uniref:Armadillo repeat-containing protein 8 n=1 Tax=Neodothiora populina TaxID=2781224 RepID=A0ABR3PNK6_9PEZI
MVHPTYLVALRELKTCTDPEEQSKLLRLLKNDIVGHAQRKDQMVRHGLLDPLSRMLHAATTAPTNASSCHLTSHDEIRMQATLIVGSLANAGPAFVSPILATNLLQSLLQPLRSPYTPAKILVATLRALDNLVTAWATLASTFPVHAQPPLPDLILDPITAHGIRSILRLHSQTPSHAATATSNQQLALASDLITHCCLLTSARNLLVKEGVLDALADILASFAWTHTATSTHPAPAAFDALVPMANVLSAVSAVIEGSHYRSHRLIYSPALRKVLSTPQERGLHDDLPGPNFRQHRKPSDAVSLAHLLPSIVVQKSTFTSSTFPPFALTNSRFLVDQPDIDPTPPSPLCAWLIHLARSSTDPSFRLAALRALALVNLALDADAAPIRTDIIPRLKERERQLALLAVPIAVKLVKDSADASADHGRNVTEPTTIRSEACAVLAKLIRNNVELQKAAHSAQAHKYIIQILRKSFDPVSLARPMWSPHLHSLDPQYDSSPLATLGDAGLPREVVAAMRCRATALEALAAISEREDSIRKDLIEAGAATYIIDSLTPFPDSVLSAASPPTVKDGNIVPVVLAACQAATAMSRSVGNLRTSLIDAGLGKPVLALLTHPSNAVQIAATDVSINLVLDFSPMREDLIAAGVIRIFCAHAKRSSPKLRQASLWGLKHLVLNAPPQVKRACLEELGSGWLVQVINGEQTEPGHSLGLSSPNAQGEQVDLLNAPDTNEMNMGTTENDESDDEDVEVMYDQNGTPFQSSGIRSTLKSNSHKARLRVFREQEFNTAVRAKQDDILIQEQALDFVRNLINGDDNIPMIDHLDSTIGINRVLDMLYNKLKPASAASLHGPAATQQQRQQQTAPLQTPSRSTAPPSWQPQELVRAALGVLIHLAAGSTMVQQQVVAQRQLLTAWLPHFNHPDRNIRVSSVWVVINLTWSDTANDREDARRRAAELRDVGIEARVRALATDADLDIRERVKTALRQIDELIEGGSRAGGGSGLGHRQ